MGTTTFSASAYFDADTMSDLDAYNRAVTQLRQEFVDMAASLDLQVIGMTTVEHRDADEDGKTLVVLSGEVATPDWIKDSEH